MIDDRKKHERGDAWDDSRDELDDVLLDALGVGELLIETEVDVDEVGVGSTRSIPFFRTSPVEELAF